MDLRRWRRGDKLLADHLDEAVEAINSNLPFSGGSRALVTTGAGGTIIDSVRDAFQRCAPGQYPIENNSGANREQYEILGIDGPLFDPTVDLELFQQFIAFKGIVPTAPTHYSRWAICAEPILDGEIGLALIGGPVSAVQISVSSVDHYNAGITDGDPTQLTSGNVAVARMLFKPPSTGLQWMYVTLNNTMPTTLPNCP